MKISGSLGSHDDIRCIASLHFYTNLATYGPFGSSTCGSCGFEFCMKDGAIVGFYGNHGVYLNAIGVFLKSTAALFIPGIQYLLPEVRLDILIIRLIDLLIISFAFINNIVAG